MADHLDLEAALRDLGARIAFPEPAYIASLVRQRLVAVEAHAGASEPPRWRRLSVAAAALVVIVATLLAVSPWARSATADLFRVAGIEIRFGTSRGDAPPLGQNLRLGTRVDLEEARARVEFPVRVPRELGDPPEVYVRNGVVSLLYDQALVTEFAAEADDDVVVKEVPTGSSTVRQTEVGGVPGYWFAGEPHRLVYISESGETRTETLRLATNTLVWADEGVTYRVEADIPLGEALRIARSVDS